MDKYIQAECKLAEALGYHQLTYPHFSVDPCWAGLRRGDYSGGKECIPRWCRDDAAAFKLMVEYDLPVHYWKRAGWVGDAEDEFFQCALLSNHTDKYSAVRYAIVQAVIMKLRNNM